MFTIARLTSRDMLNKKVLPVGIILTLLYLGLFGVGLYFAEKDLRNAVELIRMTTATQFLTTGLFISGVIVSAITILSSVGSISSEIGNNIMLVIATKPLSRAEIFLGKYLGMGLILVCYSIFLFVATNLIVKHAFRFSSDSFLVSMVLFSLQPLVLLAIAMWGSTFLSTLRNGITISFLYSMAVIGGIVEQLGAQMSYLAATVNIASSLTTLGIVTSLLMPIDSLYRLVNFVLLSGSSVPIEVMKLSPFCTTTPASQWMLFYTAAYMLSFMGLGILKFYHRDI